MNYSIKQNHPIFKSASTVNFESRKEMVDGKWSGEYIFENEWQSFRTKKDRNIELKSVFREYAQSGKYKIAIKVVDIFGNDTMKVVEVNI